MEASSRTTENERQGNYTVAKLIKPRRNTDGRDKPVMRRSAHVWNPSQHITKGFNTPKWTILSDKLICKQGIFSKWTYAWMMPDRMPAYMPKMKPRRLSTPITPTKGLFLVRRKTLFLELIIDETKSSGAYRCPRKNCVKIATTEVAQAVKGMLQLTTGRKGKGHKIMAIRADWQARLAGLS